MRGSQTTPDPAEEPGKLVWSKQQTAVLDQMRDYVRRVGVWRAQCAEGGQQPEPPEPPVLMVLGGPGSGKSVVTRELTRILADANLTVLSSAMTAVAATNMCDENITALTCHSCYHLPVRRKRTQKHKEPNSALDTMGPDQQRMFSSRVRVALDDRSPVCTVVDECSMLTVITLGHILQRYSEVRDLRLGAFIFVGDFFQVRAPSKFWIRGSALTPWPPCRFAPWEARRFSNR